MDGLGDMQRWLDAMPVPALAVGSRGPVACNAAARDLLGHDAASTWSQIAAGLPEAPGGGIHDVALPSAEGPLPLEVSIGHPVADGIRVVVLRDAREDAAVRDCLERALDFERLLTRSSAALMRASDARLDEEIEQVLGDVGRFFDIDRAYVFRIDEASATQSNTHEWTAPGISREAPNLQGIPLDTFPWLLARLRQDAVFAYASLDDLPSDARNERAEFEREGIRSILIVPLWSAGSLRGFIGFDAVRRRVEWSESYVVGLRLLAQMLAGATDTRAMARQLRWQAMHDAVTGLPNRLYLRDRFAGCTQWQQGALVAVVDVDDFKVVNDRHGHGAGDAVLREVARRLAAVLGPDGLVARIGGDEFVVVQPHAREPAARFGARLVEAVEAPFELGGVSQSIGISVGLVDAAAGPSGLDAWLDHADAAMYRAKASGKRRWALAEIEDVAG
jgi:diguanylate cyclase (GGDEF)-like protein